MNSGSHYWEIKVILLKKYIKNKIQKYVDEEDIFIGIARKNIDLYS